VQEVSTMKTQGAKMRGEPKTIGTADLKLFRWAARSTPIQWQIDRFIRNASCKADKLSLGPTK